MIPLYYGICRDRFLQGVDRAMIWAVTNQKDFFGILGLMILFIGLGFVAAVKSHYENKYTALVVERDAAIKLYTTTKASLDIAIQTQLVNADLDQKFAELYTPNPTSYYPIVLKNQNDRARPQLGVTYQVPEAVIVALYNQILAGHGSLTGKLTDCELPSPPTYIEYTNSGPVMQRTIYLNYTAALLGKLDTCKLK